MTGTWKLTSQCPFNGDAKSNGYWGRGPDDDPTTIPLIHNLPWKVVRLILTEDSEGWLRGTVVNDLLNPTIETGRNYHAHGGLVMLILKPSGWKHLIVLSGYLSRIPATFPRLRVEGSTTDSHSRAAIVEEKYATLDKASQFADWNKACSFNLYWEER